MNWKCLFIGAAYIGMSGTFSFPFQCPENKAKVIRSRHQCPKPSKYHCLMNFSSRQYVETCKNMSLMIEGRYAVLNNFQIDHEPCIFLEFQPKNRFSNEAFKCIYKKNLCTETGQVIFSNGTASTNSRCQCDYRKGFSFVIKPQQKCYCDPSQEDCTCYIVDCGYGKQLNSDHICQNISEANQTNQLCPDITQIERDESPKLEPSDYKETNNFKDHFVQTIPVKVVVIFVILLVGVCILGTANPTISGKLDETFQYLCTHCCTRHQKSDTAPVAIQMIDKPKDTSPVAIQMIDKPKDIVVLGTKRDVIDFISKLKNITGKLDYIAGLYANDENTQLDILLATYQFIFILYTKKFDMEKAGLSEKDVDKIRRMDLYPKIKIVCNCEKSLVIEAIGRIDLNFSNENDKWDDFVKKDSKYLDILKQLRVLHYKKTEKKLDRNRRPKTTDVF